MNDLNIKKEFALSEKKFLLALLFFAMPLVLVPVINQLFAIDINIGIPFLDPPQYFWTPH